MSGTHGSEGLRRGNAPELPDMATMTAKVCRKLDNGVRRLREADRFLKRPASKYSFRKAGQVRRPTRRVAAKVLTLHPAIVQ